jgi:hypothetical protein
MSRLSTSAYPNDAPIHGLTDIHLRLLPTDVGCGTRAPHSQTTHGNTHWLLATQTSAVATKTCLDYLHPHTRTMSPSTASPINLQPTSNGYGWYPGPRTQNRHTTPQFWPHKRPHGHQTTYMHLLAMLVGLRTSTWPLLPFVQPEHSSSACDI